MNMIKAWRHRRSLRRERLYLMFTLEACHSERRRLRRLFAGPLMWQQIDQVAATEDAALLRLREIGKELEASR